MTMKMKWTLALATTLLLAACNGGPDEETVNDTNVMNVPDEVPVDTIPANEVQLPSNAAENKVAPPEFSDQQQIQDDADATGMTSRLPEDAGTSSSSDSAAHEQSGSGNGAPN